MSKEIAHPPVLQRDEKYYAELFEKTKGRKEGLSEIQIFLIMGLIAVVLFLTLSYIFLFSVGAKMRFSPTHENIDISQEALYKRIIYEGNVLLIPDKSLMEDIYVFLKNFG